jgi:predicted Zn finger-like uncharacterized protein
VIVNCEKCETRFRLDAARIPARGARVRCSRCKHAFFVRPPDADDDEALAEVVAEATDPGAAGVPDATRDLPGPGETDPALSHGLRPLGGEPAEEQWEFNEDPPAEHAPARREAPAARRPGAAPKPRAAAPKPPAPKLPSLDDVGSPDEWDLLAASEARPPEVALPPPVVEAPPPRAASPQASQAAVAPEKARVQTAPRAAALRAPLARLTDGAGWIAALALLLVGLAFASRAPEAAPAPHGATRSAPPGLALEALRGRHVENAHGMLFVVSGRLEAGIAPGTGLEAALVAADGAPIPGATAWAGPALADAQLRELPPERLRAAQEARAGEIAGRPGAEFHAVFAELPRDAADFALRAARLPGPPPSALPPSIEAPAGAPATASSPR